MRLILKSQRSSSTINCAVLYRNRTETIVDNACLCDEDAATVHLRWHLSIEVMEFYAHRNHKGINRTIGRRN